eukprot:XP_019923681.1 PREDICTED: somatostatin-like receptor F_48D10.1 [Crassostrea gigas]
MNTTLYNHSYGFDNVTNVDGRKPFLLDNNSNDFHFRFHTDVDYIINIICAVIAVLGGIGNIVTIVIISYQSKLHTPTFVVIKCLAVSDFFGLFTFSFQYFTNVLTFLRRQNTSTYANLFEIIVNAVYLNSTSHVLLLCAVRYLLVVHPLDSRRYLTVTVVSLGSLTSWILSFVFAVIYVSLYSAFGVRNQNIGLALEMASTIIVILYLVLSVIIIISMHFKKMAAIKTSATKGQVHNKMHCIAFVMLFCLVLCRLPDIVVHFFLFVKKMELFTIHLRNCYFVLNCFTHSYNPYMLFVFSCLKSCRKK